MNKVPHGMGFTLGVSQLVLYAMYKNAKSSNTAIDYLEEGSQHQQHLLAPS